MVVGDLAVPDHHVVGEHAAHRLGEAAADPLVGHLETFPRLGASGPDLDQRLLGEMQSGRRRVGLEVGAGPVPLDGVAPLGDLPLEADLGLEGRAGQVDLDAVAGRLHVADVDQPGQGGRPQPGQRARRRCREPDGPCRRTTAAT